MSRFRLHVIFSLLTPRARQLILFSSNKDEILIIKSYLEYAHGSPEN